MRTGAKAAGGALGAASALVAARLGLDFPARRRDQLARALAAAGPGALTAPPDSPEWRRLVGALTVHESRFFRDRAVFAALAEHVLPELIRERRAAGDRRLRLWSAGCAEGQEPYSLAILLDRLLEPGWDVTILAHDLDPAAVERARAGVYGKWALREAPAWARKHFDGGAVAPRIRERVRFGLLNLHADPYPAGIDVLLCRNVLMYFTPEARAAALSRLRAALAPGGWLIVAPAEASSERLAPLEPVRFERAILYRRARTRGEAGPDAPAQPDGAVGPDAPAGRDDVARPDRAGAPDVLAEARAHADAGRLDAAADLLRRADRLDPRAHLLRAQVEREREDDAAELVALRAAIYLDPDCAAAHFQLGCLHRRRGAAEQARASFETAEALR